MTDPNTDSKTHSEEFQFSDDTLLSKIKKIIHTNNIRHVMIKNDKNRTLIDIPLTFGIVNTLLAPQLTTIGTITTLVLHRSIVVEKEIQPMKEPPTPTI